MENLSSKVAVVTGASRGIGRAIATRLGRDGASVAVNYVNNARAADEVVAEIKAQGGRAVAIQADMANLDDIRRLLRQTIEQLGRLDILVYSAGLFGMTPVTEVTEEQYNTIFAVNTRGALFAMQEAGGRMESGGRIVYVSSCATQMSFAASAVYSGSKAASEQFARVLARELGPRGITVNSVSPGYTQTDMLPTDPAFRQTGAEASVFGRLGEPQDIADTVAFLASDAGRWITGQNIQACGGVVMTH